MSKPTDCKMPLTGVVLAGGRSSRLGQDKLRLKVHGPDAPDLLAHSVALLSRHCGQVLVACRQGQDFPEYACVYDEHNDMGPIAGIQAALLVTGLPLLVIPCDLPFMDDATIQCLISAHAARPKNVIMTTFRQAETGFIEALTSIYEPDCLSLFTQTTGKGCRQINLIIPSHRRHDIVYTRSEARPFFNINYPEELEACSLMNSEGYSAAGTAGPAGAGRDQSSSTRMQNMSTQMDKDGNALMVDMPTRNTTERSATAEGYIRVTPRVLTALREQTTAKGDVLSVAQLAGIMGVKRTPDLIPLCHPLPLNGCWVTLEITGETVRAECTVKAKNRTGVEIEALTGVSVALLTVYDMCKGIDKGMEITGMRLLKKSGGKSGDFERL